MSKKRRSQEAKSAMKPIRNLVPTAEHTGAYQDKLNNPDHMQMSTAEQEPKRSAPVQGGNYWGDASSM